MYAPAATLYRDLGGVRVFERRLGRGPEVIVLHGGPGAHHDYLLPGFDALARGRTLVYYDQRGGGRSAVPREVPVGWREHVADLEALRRCWGLERLALAGYSWGALLAVLYALEHPERVTHLALVSPAPCWQAARREFETRFAARNASAGVQRLRAELAASGLRQGDPERYRRRSFELSVAGYFHDLRKVEQLTAFRVTARTQQEVWDSLGAYDLRPRLAELRGRVSAIVLHGSDDPIPQHSARTLADGLGAAFHLLEDCGHVPYLEAPLAFEHLLHAFLPRLG
jgi:proline iminopeptidase